MDSYHRVLKNDSGVQSMARLTAIINDWYNNINQEKRGVRSCERLMNFKKEGLIPTADKYFEYVLSKENMMYDDFFSTEDLLDEWSTEFRPDYESESEEKDWAKFDRGLERSLLDAENRIAKFAIDTVKNISDVILNNPDITKKININKLWKTWMYRITDLYWERRNRIYKEIVKQRDKGFLEEEDKKWNNYKRRYPRLPSGTIIDNEKVY